MNLNKGNSTLITTPQTPIRPRWRLLAPITLLLIAGCVHTPASPPDTEAIVPDTWLQMEGAAQGTIAMPARWWQAFGSAELDSLIDQAMAANFSLQASLERVEQARAQRRSSRGSLLPQLDGSYSFSRNDRWDENDQHSDSDSDRLQLSLGYEVDLWGRLRAADRAAQANLVGTVFDHQAARLALQAEVTASYLQFLAACDRLNFARLNLQLNQDTLRLVQLQHGAGASSRLELVQQEAVIASQQSQLNDLEALRQQSLYNLALLTGRKPGEITLQGDSLSRLQFPAPAATQPGDLLLRRPDIQASEQRLLGFDANVQQARAALYPGLRLSASIGENGLLSSEPSTLASSLAASLTQPLFHGGQLRAEVNRAEARRREAIASYYQSVLNAVVESQTALTQLQLRQRNLDLRKRELDLAEQAFHLAQTRYKSGAEDFFSLLDAQRTLVSRRDSHVQFELSRYQAVLDLYRALGGGADEAEETQEP